MNRRLLGPVGGPIGFFVAAALVFAVLGWVTSAALRVEESQIESALRADREKDLRIALRQLDGRMLPALGVEDTRPFHEYRTYSADDPITIYGPACAPLLAADLPDWMQLHFQVDPEGGWESPQVLTKATRLSLRRNWPELPLRNANKPRAELLVALGTKFPARQVSDAFAARERAAPQPSPLTAPLSMSDASFEERVVPPVEREVLPKSEVPALAPQVLPPAKQESETRRNADDAPLALDRAVKNRTLGEQQAAKDVGPPAPADNYARNDEKQSRELKPSDYDVRERTYELGRRDARNAAGVPQLAPKSQNSNNFALNAPPQARTNAAKPATSATAGAPLAGGLGGGGGLGLRASSSPDQKETANSDKNLEKKLKDGVRVESFALKSEAEAKGSLDFKKVETGSRGLYAMIEDARQKEAERKRVDNLYQGSFKRDEAAGKVGEPNDAARSFMAKGALAAAVPGVAGGPSGPASPPSAPAAPQPAAFGGGGPPASGAAPVQRTPVAPPAPPAKPEPVEPPAPVLPPAIDEPVPQPLAVHLGSLHPQWITAPDGSEVLVLVRTARVENKKTIYQGVALDWDKVQSALKDEVKDLFPEAKLVPVKEPNGSLREQSMTALPVYLDPGPLPAPLPAGWTALRIGLVLAWIAATIAFTAVGLSGWSLMNLAERRIRFVSAVTHELRTPLTSLRLYLDLLLSGMVTDEDKRREYLSTLNVESDRLHRLIDNVLDYARLERRRKGRDLHAVKAADIIEQVRRTWSDRVAPDGKQLVVISTLPPELDVTTDPALVQQIVGNLIDNARKYTREATDTRIWLWAKTEGANRVVFEVEDRGPGVPPREQKLIFRAFRRGETADTIAGGAGLGLALCKDWAEVLGGKLTYRGAEGGVGSCFRLELPLKS